MKLLYIKYNVYNEDHLYDKRFKDINININIVLALIHVKIISVLF
jgi:hypothetical protein